MTRATTMHVSSEPGVKGAGRRAFSLIEILVAVTLMSVIVLGLLTMFSQTQRAFRAGITQVDVMEGGRAACELMARELEQVTPTRLPGSLNFYASWNNRAYGYLPQSLPGKDLANNDQWRTNVLQDLRFVSRENQAWTGVGYFVLTNGNNTIGTLYRCETNASNLDSPQIAALVLKVGAARLNRIIDNVVHLRVLAYDATGYLITPNMPYVTPFGTTNNFVVASNTMPAELSYEYQFRDTAVPAYLELEIGVLEAKTAERTRNLATIAAQQEYLKTKSGNVQIFRQRIAVRNVIPSVYQ